jgi:hypothetical protein
MNVSVLRKILPLRTCGLVTPRTLASLLECVDDVESGLSRDPDDIVMSIDDELVAGPLLSMALRFQRSGTLSAQGMLAVRDAALTCAADAERVRSIEAELVLDESFRRMSGLAESDPNGIDAHAPGAKLDAGKNRCALVIGGFSSALWQVSRVGTFGAAKYTPNGWKEVEGGIDRYTDAMARHLLAEAMGEELDSESGLLHAAHAAWNALARLELILKERAGDD